MYLYKIISPIQWTESQSSNDLSLTPEDKAFIHFSTKDQLPRIIEKYWKGKEYIILKIKADQLIGILKLEANRPGGEEYYHLYEGTIPHNAIENTQP